MVFFFQEKKIEKVSKLLLKAKSFASYRDAFDLIERREKKRFIISFLNMYAIQLAIKNDCFYNALIKSDLLLLDGIALKVLCKIKKVTYGINMNGSDFIPAFINNFD